jgi:hypothetical protein
MRRIRSSLAGTAHLFHSGQRGGVTAVSAAITRVEGADLTLRCARPGTLVPGAHCVVAVATDEGQKRARAVVVEVTDLTTRVRLEEALALAERRAWPRADVVLRLMVRPLAEGGGAPRAQSLSLVAEGGWQTEEVVLSGTGLRGPLGADLACGDRLELRLHVPGRRGGDHFVTRAEVVCVFDDQDPPEQAVRFLDLPEAARIRLSEIVDQARLDDFAEDAW